MKPVKKKKGFINPSAKKPYFVFGVIKERRKGQKRGKNQYSMKHYKCFGYKK
jgi:hypothetical protein